MGKKLIRKGLLGLLTRLNQRVRNLFTSDKSHLTYTPTLNEGDSHNNSIVIDKGRQHMYVYDKKGNLTFHTPVSTGARTGNKTKEDDYKTPVGKFAISQFEGNRDPKVFGAPEFWRLRGTGFSGIGIHGDAHQPELIGLPASHGCVRMPCDSIASFLKKGNPFVGLTVYILNEDGKYEKK